MEKKKGSGLFLKIVISLVVAIVLFFVLLTVESSMLKNYEKKMVVIATQPILRGTVIDQANVNVYFKNYEVDKKLVSENTITKTEELVGTIVVNNLDPNEIVNANDFKSEKDVIARLEEPVKVSVAVSGISNAVGGRIRSGDLVDITVLNKNTGDAEYLLEDVYILEAMTSDGVTVAKEDTSRMTTLFNVLIDKKDVNDAVLALSQGTIVLTYPDVEISIEENETVEDVINDVVDDVVDEIMDDIQGEVDEVVEELPETENVEEVIDETLDASLENEGGTGTTEE